MRIFRQIKELDLFAKLETNHVFTQAWNQFIRNQSTNSSTSDKITANELVNLVICGIPQEDCYTRECESCGENLPSNFLSLNREIDENDICSWSKWKTFDNRVDFQAYSGSISLLLREINTQWSKFLLHSYCTQAQREYIAQIRSQSSSQSYVVAQIDFAENYTFVRQREPQSAHWNNTQATLFTIHLKIGLNHKNLCIISDYRSHDTAFVYVAQKYITDFVKRNYPSVTMINYLR